MLEECGASLLDFTNSGPIAGEAAAKAVAIPVIGGLGGGPWLDGRVRMAYAAVGYLASALEGLSALVEDVRAGRQIRGAGPRRPSR
jgi:3-methyl-2-oxobutanoate hydroxymethyltransferase